MYLIFVKPLYVNTVMSPNLSYLVLLTVFGIKDSIGIKSTVPSFLRIMIGVSGSTLSPYKTSMPTDLHFSIVSNMVYLPTAVVASATGKQYNGNISAPITP